MLNSAPERDAEQAWLLEVFRLGEDTARVSLQPAHPGAAATVQGYALLRFDPREVERLGAELRVTLGRANMRGRLDDATSAEIRKLGMLLFDELLPEAVKAALRQARGDLLLRTDPSLTDVPWELLHTGEGFLALRWSIGRLIASAGLRQAAPARRLAPPYNALILADPCGDLDAAYDEGVSLHNMLDGQLYLNAALKSSEVSRAFLREHIREFDILHYAGHAEVEGQGDGWLLSDGRFTADDVLRLRGARPFPALVFANACGSGRGAPRAGGTSTLAKTLLDAGVRHVIGTHWDVPDQIASSFAHHVYRAMTQGMSIGAAMRRARTALSIAHGEGALLWSPYCLYGDPTTVYFAEALKPHFAPIEDDDDPLALEIIDPDPLALEIIEPDPMPSAQASSAPVRSIEHRFDLDVADLLSTPHAPSATLRPHPSMRSEHSFALEPPMTQLGESLATAKRGMVAVCAVAGVALLLIMVYEGAYAAIERLSAPAPATSAVLGAPATSSPTPPQLDQARATAAALSLVEDDARTRRAPPVLQAHLTAQLHSNGARATHTPIRSGARLHSGDRLRLTLQTDRDVYAAVLRLSDDASTQLLFPHPMAQTRQGNYLRANTPLLLPSAERWFRLNPTDTPRQTTLLILASKAPIRDLTQLREAIAQRLDAPAPSPDPSALSIDGGDPDTPAADGAGWTHRLADIQSILDQRDIDVVQAIHYHHLP